MITVSGVGARSGFSVLMIDQIPNLHTIDTGQCFPLYLYEKTNNNANDTSDLFAPPKKDQDPTGYSRQDGISDAGLAHFQAAYPDETLTKEAIFYYSYGLLHAPDYRKRYANNLSKALPRIPCVKTAHAFGVFVQAGRDLADLHVNYESVTPYNLTWDTDKRARKDLSDDDYHVTKMKFAQRGGKDTVIYNHHISLKDIPLTAYDYIINGKPALTWVMARQAVTTEKNSGLVNDANTWASETMGNPKYPSLAN